MKSFNPKSPGAVRCRDCQFCPSNHGQRCEAANRRVLTLGSWRLCSSFRRKIVDLKEVVTPRINSDKRTHRWQHIDAFCGDLYLGTEPLWSYIGTEDSEREVLEDLRLWLRQKRATAFREYEIQKRRLGIKPVDD